MEAIYDAQSFYQLPFPVPETYPFGYLGMSERPNPPLKSGELSFPFPFPFEYLSPSLFNLGSHLSSYKEKTYKKGKVFLQK